MGERGPASGRGGLRAATSNRASRLRHRFRLGGHVQLTIATAAVSRRLGDSAQRPEPPALCSDERRRPSIRRHCIPQSDDRASVVSDRPSPCAPALPLRTSAIARHAGDAGPALRRHLNHADRRGPALGRTIAFAPAGPSEAPVSSLAQCHARASGGWLVLTRGAIVRPWRTGGGSASCAPGWCSTAQDRRWRASSARGGRGLWR
jgi:hypothetical protein